MVIETLTLEKLFRRLQNIEDLLQRGLTSRNIRTIRSMSIIHAQGTATSSAPFVVRFFVPANATLVQAVLMAYLSASTQVDISRDGSIFVGIGTYSGTITIDITSFLNPISLNVVRFTGNADVTCQINLKLDVMR